MHSAGPFRDLRAATFALLGFTLILVPYATVHLEYQLALRLQALGILSALLAALVVSFRAASQSSAQRPHPAPLLRLALLLYLSAVVLGTVVALLRGNSTTNLAGQLLALTFLPLAALVGWRLGAGRWRQLVATLPLAVVVAVVLHLIRWLIDVAHGKTVLRLFFGNAVSVSELALLALLLSFAAASSPRRWQRVVALSSIPLLCVYIVGAATRGVWLVVLPMVALYWLLAGLRGVRSRQALWTVVGLAVLAVALFSALAYRISHPTDRLMDPSYVLLQKPHQMTAAGKPLWRAGRQPRRLTRRFPLAGPGSYRVSARIRGGREGLAVVAVRLINEKGKPIDAIRLQAYPHEQWRYLETIASIPPASVQAQAWLVTKPGSVGNWRIDDLRVDRLGPSWATPLLNQSIHLGRRLRTIADILPGDREPADPSVQFRFAESRELLHRVREASLGRQLFGHGLGATFSLANIAPAAKRAGQQGAPQNYIHNYYSFLLYKLGILGMALVLLSLGLVVTCALRATLRTAAGPRRAFLAATTASLVGYSVLALSTPVFVDFRLTPIWGLLIAALAGALSDSQDAG